MRHYEIVALVHPDQSAQITEIVDRYRKIVEDSGGTVHRQENWGRRKLAYPIKNMHKADYFLLNVECEASVKDRIENDFKYYDSILRSLCIRKDEAVTEPSPILKKIHKQEEEERAAKEREQAELERLKAVEAAKAAEEADKAAEESAEQAEAEEDVSGDKGAAPADAANAEDSDDAESAAADAPEVAEAQPDSDEQPEDGPDELIAEPEQEETKS